MFQIFLTGIVASDNSTLDGSIEAVNSASSYEADPATQVMLMRMEKNYTYTCNMIFIRCILNFNEPPPNFESEAVRKPIK